MVVVYLLTVHNKEEHNLYWSYIYRLTEYNKEGHN